MDAASTMVRENPGEFERATDAAQFVLSRTALRPQIALVLGSGLGAFADELTDAVRIPFADIPHYPKPSAEGHAGKLVIGKVGDIAVAAMQGRVHYYEGHSIKDVIFPMRVFGRMGIKAAILTNAAGGVSTRLKPGTLVILQDHINLQGVSALAGPNDERFGTRFVDMSKAYDDTFLQIASRAAHDLHIDTAHGVYAAVSGPSYETPAEIRYLRTIGADVVGMSTVQETMVARHMGIRVLAISCVTNMAAGILDQPITHQEVLETGARVRGQFVALLKAVIPQIQREVSVHGGGK
jgi:purine-nucleoside phosphorylase